VATTATERRLFVGGEWIETGDWLDVRSPFSGDVVGRVAKGSAEDARHAIDAAERAMADPLPAHRRAAILDKVAELLERRHDEVARTISDEAGKPLKAARVEAKRAISTYTFAAVEARKLTGEMVPMDASESGDRKLAFTLRRPIGIVGAISPFNFPCNLVAHKLAPSLAAGCAVVLKPASQTPLSALLLAELEEEAGLPPGWLNVVVGPSSEIGDVLVEDDRVAALTFTGSGDVGWGLKERAPRKRVALELGNATPAVVCCDAPAGTPDKLAANAFSFAGQSCISVQRIYVMEDAWDEFVRAFVPKVEALKVGDPADDDTDVGPVIDEDARERILDWIKASRGEVLTGGETNDEGLIRPTVIANPDPRDKVQCEEVFGPVVTLTRTSSLDEAIELANSTRYGLQAAIFSGSLYAALEAAKRLEFGGVIINEAPTFRADQMPYGGVKASGNTREGPAYAVRELTEEHLVVIDLAPTG
jgi:acyl-CoA reductase-like NAD-dependent aldehyde dehydrogenase